MTCTILLSRPQRPTPPNAPLPRLANRLALSFIGRAALANLPRRTSQPTPNAIRANTLWLSPRRHNAHSTTVALLRTSAIATTQLSTIEMQGPRHVSHQLLRHLLRRRIPPRPRTHPRSDQPRSTKAFSHSPNPNGAATSRTCALWRPNPASCADVIPLTRITCALPNHRALGVKVSDEFTVPLCRGHHRQLHQAGNEVAWWKTVNIDALPVARQLWEQTHPQEDQTQSAPEPESAAKP